MSFFSRSIAKLSNRADIVVSKNKLLDSQWLKITNGNDKITYAFLGNKRLIVATNGNGLEGKWEFIVDNYTLIIETENMEVFNCNIINDEYLILNKDSTTDIQIFGNSTKFKNSSPVDVRESFNKLFYRLNLQKGLHHEEKLYAIQLYELKSLFELGKDKERAIRLIDELVQDSVSGATLRKKYQEVIGADITTHLRNSKFKVEDTKEIVYPLLKYGTIKAK